MGRYFIGILPLTLLFFAWGCGGDDDVGVDSGLDSGADTDIDGDSDTDTDADTDADTDTDTDAGSDSGSVLYDESVYIKASNTDEFDSFGMSVALDGDTLAVGARWEAGAATGMNGDQADNSAEGAGAVYVFTRAGSEWSQQAYIKASNTDKDDSFGWSVALDGDTLAVGSIGEAGNATGVGGNQADNSAAGSGAVYVFTRTDGVWSQQAYIKASNTEASDSFGRSVALDSDTLAVGAIYEDSAATGIGGNQDDNEAVDSGAVYVFTRAGSTWSQQAYIKASNTDKDDWFGSSVALDVDTLAVGAYGEDSNATGVGGNQAGNSASGSGAVYVFTRTGSEWNQQEYIKASNTGSGDYFGYSVALEAETLAVGAIYEASSATGVDGNQADNGADMSGAAYVFTRTGSTWSQQAYIKASNTDMDDWFGASVALHADTLAIGADGEAGAATGVGGDQADNNASYSGAVYVFMRTGLAWSQQAYIKASNTDKDDWFGASVALQADTLAVGAIWEAGAATGVGGDQVDNSAWGAGAVYVYR